MLGRISLRRMHLAFCLRVTTAALLTFGVGRLTGLPFVLWAVLTAVILTQMSVGKSVKATIDYVIGTLGGAIYAGCLAALVPHSTDAALAVVLAIALVPLALLAAISSRFAVAPSTAAIVVLAPKFTHATPFASATDRVIEVALGGLVALVVSLVVFPARARMLAKHSAAAMLETIAQTLPDLFRGFTQESDAEAILYIQRRIGSAFAQFDATDAEARHERVMFLATEPEFGPLRLALLRMRHDLVMIGRAAVPPLPETLHGRLGPPLAKIASAAAGYLRGCATALLTDHDPPARDLLEGALDEFADEIAKLRSEGALRALSVDALEYVFALAFALEQWRRDLQDLAGRLSDYARTPVDDNRKEGP